MISSTFGNRHLFIPDTQVKPGVPLEHLKALGNAILEYKPDTIVHIGDHWDMPSLSSYESKSSKYFHDKTYKDDIEAGKLGMEYILRPLWEYNRKRIRNKKKPYSPRLVFTLGNHDGGRVNRALNEDPRLEGTISTKDFQLEEMGWEVYPFLVPVNIDGVIYCHYMCNPLSLKKNPLGGNIENKLLRVGHSFSMGHQQVYQHGMIHDGLGKPKLGLVWGTFYMHDEDYAGPQGNARFDGVMLKNEVEDGFYCGCPLSLNYLLEKFL